MARSKPEASPVEAELTIDTLGHKGDGLAQFDGRDIFVERTLPGERVRARVIDDRAIPLQIIEASEDRRRPPCKHFALCGGCTLQHVQDDALSNWKRQQVRKALSQAGLEKVDVAPTIATASGGRRRAILTAAKRKGRTRIGFQVARSHDLVDLETCPILNEAIVTLLPRLRLLMDNILTSGQSARLTVTHYLNGIDLDLDGLGDDPDLQLRQQLQIETEQDPIIRISFQGEPVLERAAPEIEFGPVKLTPPPRAFLQASEEGEGALQNEVVNAVSENAGSGTIADLFAGCGTFTGPLLQQGPVHAVEGDEGALHAFVEGSNNTEGLPPLTVERRDLFRRPLLPGELKGFGTVVIDPPRQGATAQFEQLALSNVPCIVSVSCNPATFARDARTLVNAGWAIGKVQPIDQFVWSTHTEVVGVFTKA